MGRIVVVGSVNADLVARAPRRPRGGETLTGWGFRMGPGGKGLNQAVAAKRAGGDVALVAAVGADHFGDILRAAIVKEHIDARRVRVSLAPTGVAQITVTDDGENSIIVIPGANSDAHLTPEDEAMIDSASHVMVQLERPIELVRRTLERARRGGVSTVVTPAPVVEDFTPLLGLCDVVVANESEARALTGGRDVRESAVRLSAEERISIITRGASGCIIAVNGRIQHERSAPVVTAVDSTAAGDTFAGYLTAALAEGRDLASAVATATDAAALSVTRPGAVSSIPTAAEVEAFALR
ncbi:ribokinase [Microbacterium insulae]|uniref:Ribokinase n=1 Tax=Microbacterium insulae TaxID=483014 RepID=A0ABW3AHC9_9MICO